MLWSSPASRCTASSCSSPSWTMAGWAAPPRLATSASPPCPSTCVDWKRTLASDSSSVTGSAYGRRRRPYALPVTLDESDAKVRFQSTQVLGHGGLADVASLGGAAHPAMVQDGEEQLEAVHREARLGHRINPIEKINNSYWSYGATCASLGQPLESGAERPRRSA